MNTSLQGRFAVITGGGSGLGRAISISLARNGADVAILGRRLEPLAETAQLISSVGRRAVMIECDTSNPASVDAAARKLDIENVSILINNAGVGGPVSELVDINPDDWDDVFAVNVRGVYLMSRAVLPGMLQRGHGDIINLASVLGKRPLAGRTPYAASKAAVLAITSTLAFEVGPHGIRVNSLSPGPVDGPRMHRNFRLESERRGIPYAQAENEYVSRSASRRMISEDEVAEAVIAILGLSGMTGADIDLTAGMAAR